MLREAAQAFNRQGYHATTLESVAKRLGNTKAVCRKCYIHPAVFDSYMDGSMLKTVGQRAKRMRRSATALNEAEAAVLGLLQRRIASDSRKRRTAPTRSAA